MRRDLMRRVAVLEEGAAKNQVVADALVSIAKIRGFVMEEFCEGCRARFLEAEQHPPTGQPDYDPNPLRRHPAYYALREAIVVAYRECCEEGPCQVRIIRRLRAIVQGGA